MEPKVAVPRKTNPKLVMRTRKIFVGGLSATTSLEDIKNYFEQFSKVSKTISYYFVIKRNRNVVLGLLIIYFHSDKG